MKKLFPNEPDEYRIFRDELLKAEIELRAQVEKVAALRRKLPQGGKLKENYIFDELIDEKVTQVKFSELFNPGKDSLIIYSMMFGKNDEEPCPMCNSIVDGLNGQAMHVTDKTNMVVIGRAPIKKLMQWAKKRNWNTIRILSSSENSYNTDYLAEDTEGNQMPMLNVFQKKGEDIFHFYGTELLYAPTEKGQDARHVDMIWPLWNLFDLTPEGRGTDWYPKYEYKK